MVQNPKDHTLRGVKIQKIRVLRIIARLNIGGPAIHTILLSRHMETLGYETALIAGKVGPEEGDMAYLAEAEGVQPIVLGTLGKSLRPVGDLKAFFCILRLLFTFRPHILDTHTAKAGTLGRSAAFVYNSVQRIKFRVQSMSEANRVASIVNSDSLILSSRCKMVHTFHGHALWGYFSPFKSKIFQVIERVLARITDAIVVVSEELKGELCEQYGVGRPERYRVIPLGLELTSLFDSANHKGQFRSNLGMSGDATKLVGIIGRLTPIKNHHLFLEAVKMLMSNGPGRETRFVVVGDGELRQDLEGVTKQLGLSKPVTFTGWLKDLVPVYADLDILALASISEGTPVTVIEAMAAGVPVVATDVGGVRELVSEGGRRNSKPEEGTFEVCERGVLVNRGDVVGFARGLNHLLENPGLCKKMGRRGKDYARRRHSKDRLIADMDRLYRSLL